MCVCVPVVDGVFSQMRSVVCRSNIEFLCLVFRFVKIYCLRVTLPLFFLLTVSDSFGMRDDEMSYF